MTHIIGGQCDRLYCRLKRHDRRTYRFNHLPKFEAFRLRGMFNGVGKKNGRIPAPVLIAFDGLLDSFGSLALLFQVPQLLLCSGFGETYLLVSLNVTFDYADPLICDAS